MGIETATYITDLVAANPGSSDLRSQGDDHIRLIKTVLQDTFPTASKAWYNPTSASKSADFTVLAADMNKTFLVDTTGGVVNMTLPTLASGDAGWECFLIKTTAGVNPVMVKPPSGTLTSGAISGLSAARRSVPGSKIRCWWSGTGFYISRSEGVSGPVGSCIEYHGSTLPYGYEFPNGQTLASVATLYPEYNAVIGSGVTLDKRGRYSAALDNLGGSAANRITNAIGGVDGATLGAVGGQQVQTIATGNIPQIAVSVSGSCSGNFGVNIPQSTGAWNGVTTVNASSNSGVYPQVNSAIGNISSFTGTCSASGNIGNVSPTAMKILPPTIMVSQLLVTE